MTISGIIFDNNDIAEDVTAGDRAGDLSAFGSLFQDKLQNFQGNR